MLLLVTFKEEVGNYAPLAFGFSGECSVCFTAACDIFFPF